MQLAQDERVRHMQETGRVDSVRVAKSLGFLVVASGSLGLVALSGLGSNARLEMGKHGVCGRLEEVSSSGLDGLREARAQSLEDHP